MINPMRIEFDPAKNTANQIKHGEFLNAAEGIDWEKVIVSQDQRRNYGETRQVGYAPRDGRLYCVVFVDRGNVRRIISLRRANKREIKRYAREIHGIYPSHS